MATTRFMKRHIGKGKTIAVSITESTDYGKNPVKTRGGELVSAFACDPRTVDNEFMLAKRQYFAITGREQRKENDVLIYQIRQSFKPGEITPEEANRIGYELAERWTKGNHAFMVTTHIDRAHIHNHIYYNSTTLDCTRKFKDFFRSARALRRISDRLCLENGLSVVENPEPSKGRDGKWPGGEKQPSLRDKLRQSIDAVLAEKPADFAAFLRGMETAGYVIHQGKNITFQSPEQKRPFRCNSLKGDYTEDAIRERIEGKRIVLSSRSSVPQSQPKKINLLIDLQSRVKTKGSPGYERWAKVFNLKQLSQTFNYLEEHNLLDYAELEQKTAAATTRHNDLSEQIKAAEKRMAEISDLQKHIGAYSKTRDVYAEYRKAGYSKKFHAEHEGEIILHQAAKKAFDALGLKKLPTIKTLQAEYATLLAEKKKLYQSYRQVKDEQRELLTVKQNAAQLIRYSSAGTEIEKDAPRR